jgi:hypothetical protein
LAQSAYFDAACSTGLLDSKGTALFNPIRRDLKQSFDHTLVDELLAAYQEAKRNFYLGGLRLSAVEGGRFCEAAFRMLEQVARGAKTFTPLGTPLNTDAIIKASAQLPKSAAPEGIRIHIPRALRVVYDIRNKRDAAHLADGIDPNIQDATFVVAVLDWILAEFVRVYHKVSADDAQRIINDLVMRRAPAVQDFDGFLKVLRPDLQASDRILLLLYERGARGATFEELLNWAHPKMRKNLRRTLEQLEHDRALVYSKNDLFRITIKGMQEVERRKLHEAE